MVLTEEGKQVVNEICLTSQFNEAFNQLCQTQQTELTSALEHLLSILIRSNKMKTFGVCRNCLYNQKYEAGYFCTLTQTLLTDDDVICICREHKQRNQKI